MNTEFKSLIGDIKYKYALTQAQIAERLGITRPYISEIINGRAPFSDALREKIEETFPLDKMLEEKSNEPNTVPMLPIFAQAGSLTGWSEGILGAGAFQKLSSNWARHTWATLCAEIDIPDPTITLGMGHKTAGHKTTAIYIKRDMKKVDEANRLVIDYVTKTVPHFTAQDGTS